MRPTSATVPGTTCPIDRLMQGVASLRDPTRITAVANARTWIVEGDAEAAVFVDYLPERALLVFSSDIGVPLACDSIGCHEEFLRYAQAWDETDGLRVGIEPADGSAWLIQDVALHGFGAFELARRLDRFEAGCSAWRQVISSGRRLAPWRSPSRPPCLPSARPSAPPGRP